MSLYFELYIKRARPEIQGNARVLRSNELVIRRESPFSKAPDMLMSLNEACNQLKSGWEEEGREINVQVEFNWNCWHVSVKRLRFCRRASMLKNTWERFLHEYGSQH